MAALKIFYILSALTIIISPVRGVKQRCFHIIGCFNSAPPFDLPDDLLPESPKNVGTKFYLFTREKSQPEILTYGDPGMLKRSHFSGDRPTKVITHGLNSNSEAEWVIDLRKTLLEHDDYNVIVVDWRNGAGLLSYEQAVANTRMVATQLKTLLAILVRTHGLQLKDVHLIGHSLGAHVSGYAGTLLGSSALGRITGLDPADPNFEDLPYVVRLDQTDAEFVDVIHSDAREFNLISGYGLMQQSGHVDFYMNGGEHQPGCEFSLFDLACSHGRSHRLFIESIKSKQCRFKSFPCDSYEKFLSGECFDCGDAGCPQAGFWATENREARGKFYLQTFHEEPLCGAHYYQVLITPSRGQGNVRGQISVGLMAKNDTSSRKNDMFVEWADFGKDVINRTVVLDTSMEDLGGVHYVQIKYTQERSWQDKTFNIDRVEVTSVETGVTIATQTKVRTLEHGKLWTIGVLPKN